MISAKKPNLAALKSALKKELAANKQAPEVEPEVPQITEPEPFIDDGSYRPPPIDTLEQTGLTETMVEALVFKYMLAVGQASGRDIASAIGLPPKPIIELLSQLKARQFVFYKDSTAMGDFEYALTEEGRARARGYMDECSYTGRAPVTIDDYIASVEAQSITKEKPQLEDLKRAFSDLLINETMFKRLGPAINSGRGLFLYGYPGNGKTSIAERITASFGGSVWVPYSITVSGELITFYDPQNHVAIKKPEGKTQKSTVMDARWIEIERPTIVVGGELTMDALDLIFNNQTKITEPSLQLRSNTGTLVIDDFGRQRMEPLELLNRWIVPLEKRYDFLTLSNGKKIQMPFDQLIIFSTNLEPKDLVDEAFLRRIPYKINVIDPTEDEFRKLFEIMSPIVGVDIDKDSLDYLIETHYRAIDRPFRCCQPRDILQQVRNTAIYHGQPPLATKETIDAAVENYFSVM